MKRTSSNFVDKDIEPLSKKKAVLNSNNMDDNSTVEYIKQLDRNGLNSEIHNMLLVFQLIDFNFVKSIKYLAEELEIDISKPHGNIVIRDSESVDEHLSHSNSNSNMYRTVQKVPIIYTINNKNYKNYKLAYYFHKMNPELTNKLLQSESIEYAEQLDSKSKQLLQLFTHMDNYSDDIGLEPIKFFRKHHIGNDIIDACRYGHLDTLKFIFERENFRLFEQFYKIGGYFAMANSYVDIVNFINNIVQYRDYEIPISNFFNNIDLIRSRKITIDSEDNGNAFLHSDGSIRKITAIIIDGNISLENKYLQFYSGSNCVNWLPLELLALEGGIKRADNKTTIGIPNKYIPIIDTYRAYFFDSRFKLIGTPNKFQLEVLNYNVRPNQLSTINPLLEGITITPFQRTNSAVIKPFYEVNTITEQTNTAGRLTINNQRIYNVFGEIIIYSNGFRIGIDSIKIDGVPFKLNSNKYCQIPYDMDSNIEIQLAESGEHTVNICCIMRNYFIYYNGMTRCAFSQ